jgi:hypothetical protein
MHTRFWLLNLKGRDHLGDLSIYGRIILKCVLKKEVVKVWSRSNWFKVDPVEGSCECHNKTLVFIEDRVFSN